MLYMCKIKVYHYTSSMLACPAVSFTPTCSLTIGHNLNSTTPRESAHFSSLGRAFLFRPRAAKGGEDSLLALHGLGTSLVTAWP